MESYQLLEQEFGEWIGNPNTVAVSSGTAALHLALESLELPAGSEVIVPEFTMVACVRAVVMAGLVPRFVDCGDTDILIDPGKIEAAITRNTKAIMVVHVYGRLCDISWISDIATRHNLHVVEDCAEAHGAHTGDWSDAKCWSFYKNKIIAGEEGGMIAFSDPKKSEIARQLRSHGFDDRHDFLHVPRGVNSRLANTLAEQVRWSLREVEGNLLTRREIEHWYNSLIPDSWRMPPRDVCWVYDVQIPPVGIDRVVRSLNEQGIAARHGFKPMSMQPEFYRDPYQGLNSYKASQQILYLPISPDMTRADVGRNVNALVAAVRSAA